MNSFEKALLFVVKLLNVVVGYTGSSQNPTQMSLRFTAIIVAGFSTLAGITAALGVTLPLNSETSQMWAASIGIVAAVIAWLVGLVRYVWKAMRTP